ncbi:hypothetical protein CLK_A0164 (plasmid) [Clostridium botulinum A3 str. Loch Maree]|nr:hypothetical protein CLK_A0164 [Clostridium botulinum A3 str. Loch Maree]
MPIGIITIDNSLYFVSNSLNPPIKDTIPNIIAIIITNT